MKKEVRAIITENRRRNKELRAVFNPVTGEGCVGERVKVTISDFALKTLWLPVEMMDEPMVRQLVEAGSIKKFYKNLCKEDSLPTGEGSGVGLPEYSDEVKETIIKSFNRLRIQYDFCFWAFLYVMIKPKGEGDDIHFYLNRPQRRLVEVFERRRKQGRPIRVIIAKSRQWGGSTVTQMYMMWIQLVQKIGTNSLIVGNQKDASTEIFGMFENMLNQYPTELLYPEGEEFNPKESKLVGTISPNIRIVPQRKCKIKIGSAKNPNSVRGGDSTLIHCSEVALWEKTENKTPEQMVRSAIGGTLLAKWFMIVYESTPNGSGNFFQKEYDDAKAGRSPFDAVFVPWFENYDCRRELTAQNIMFIMPWLEVQENATTEQLEEIIAQWLWDNRYNENTNSDREESGKYYWYLWELGATFEALLWYIETRATYHDHADMASEAPSDDIEAFIYSGNRVFDQYNVNKFKVGCRAPKFIGALVGKEPKGKDALTDLHFAADRQGQLWVWQKPDIDEKEGISNRYLVVVDIGGRSRKADWSVIVVFDRYWMMDGGKPEVVAQWYGHIDMDLLAWKAAQVAEWYDHALLVIESNTLETKDRDRFVDGDQSEFILNQIRHEYDNLYARKQSEAEIRQEAPKKYGFHTNVATKPMVISTLVECVREQLYCERDDRCLDEYLSYERKKNGAFGAILGKHDDLLMTRAIGLHICFREMDLPKVYKRRTPRRLTHRSAVRNESTII